MVKNKIICIDMDDTLNALVFNVIKRYNRKYNDNVQMKDITTYSIHQHLKPSCENIFAEFCDREMYLAMKPKLYSMDVIETLMKENSVYFLTAGHPLTMGFRDEWLAKNLRGYSSKQLIMCGDKHLVKCDIIIDDYDVNVINSSATTKLLFHQYWNAHCRRADVTRVHEWLQIYNILIGGKDE